MCSRVAIVGKMQEQKDKDSCTYTEGRIRIRQLSRQRAEGQNIAAPHGPMRKTRTDIKHTPDYRDHTDDRE